MDLHAETPSGDTIDDTPAVSARLVGYARHQDPDVLSRQVQALVRLGVPAAGIYTDQASTAQPQPGLDAVLTGLQPGDRLLVTDADRLARVGEAMAEVFARIDAAGAVFCPQGIPTPPEVLRMSVYVARLPAPRGRRRRESSDD